MKGQFESYSRKIKRAIKSPPKTQVIRDEQVKQHLGDKVVQVLKGGNFIFDEESVDDPLASETITTQRSTLSVSTDTRCTKPKKYLNIFWNQHQPYYKDELNDTYTAPWVRLHATKDYYDMAAILLKYPNVHVTINLSSSLLRQLVDYVEKLKPYAEPDSPTYGKEDAFPWGKLDRCLDLLMKPVERWTEDDKKYALEHMFAVDYNAQVLPFPGYKYLWDKRARGERFTDQDYRDLKVWFTLAWMDPDFLKSEVELIGEDETGKIIKDKVTRVPKVYQKGMKAGYGPANFSEDDARALIIDTYKIMKFVIPIHRYLQNRGQIEVVTTPFYHPILPLVHDTNLASESNPGMPLPERFSAPDDAYEQVRKAKELYERLFGRPPRGMWPGEGAVSEKIIKHFVDNGIRWISSGDEVFFRSGFAADNYMPYRIDVDNVFLDSDHSDAMSFVPRSFHDRIGYDYGALRGKPDGYMAAWDFINTVKLLKHYKGVPEDMDYFITQQADGENCWHYYSNDGKDFLNALYSLLNEPEKIGIYTATPSQFIREHPIDKQWELEPLATGSWVGGDLSTWIGEPSENRAWELLKAVREQIVKADVPKPRPGTHPPSPTDRRAYLTYKIWESIYAAEGSDWFWWLGRDQDSGNDAYFARQFRCLLLGALIMAKQAGYKVDIPAELLGPLGEDQQSLGVIAYSLKPEIIGKPRPGSEIKLVTELEGKVKSVSVDMRSIGLETRYMKVKGQKAYLDIRLPRNLKPGTYILPVKVKSLTGLITSDYFVIKVTRR